MSRSLPLVVRLGMASLLVAATLLPATAQTIAIDGSAAQYGLGQTLFVPGSGFFSYSVQMSGSVNNQSFIAPNGDNKFDGAGFVYRINGVDQPVPAQVNVIDVENANGTAPLNSFIGTPLIYQADHQYVFTIILPSGNNRFFGSPTGTPAGFNQGGSYNLQFTNLGAAVVPEGGTLALMALPLMAVGIIARRRLKSV